MCDLLEIVEVCPYCETENIYIKPEGFIAVCKGCGRKIFLCDKCLHCNDDDFCDWKDGKCHRGVIEEYKQYSKEI